MEARTLLSNSHESRLRRPNRFLRRSRCWLVAPEQHSIAHAHNIQRPVYLLQVDETVIDQRVPENDRRGGVVPEVEIIAASPCIDGIVIAAKIEDTTGNSWPVKQGRGYLLLPEQMAIAGSQRRYRMILRPDIGDPWLRKRRHNQPACCFVLPERRTVRAA